MTPLAEIARDVVGGETDPRALSNAQLISGYAVFEAGYTRVFSLLIEYCGGFEAARVDLSRTLELPLNVLQRRAAECVRIANADTDEFPSQQQVAAHAAILLREMFAIKTLFESRLDNATLN